jgi:hypothetical protein
MAISLTKGVDAIPILSPISAKSNNQLSYGPSGNTAGGLKLATDQENAPQIVQ